MLSLVFLAVPIVISDLRYRRIPNIYLILLFYCAGIERVIFGVQSWPVLALATAIAVIVVFLLEVGMGDAKLFIVLALGLNFSTLSQYMLLLACIFLIASMQILTTCIFIAKFPRSIAMAPAIIFGTTLYLAARERFPLPEYVYALVNSW